MDDAADFLSDIADGDARAALNAIELAILTTVPSEDGKIHITLEVAEECIQKKNDEPNDIGHEKDIKEYFRNIGKDPERYAYKDPSLGGNPEKPWE